MDYFKKKDIIIKDYKDSPYDNFEDYISDMIDHWREELELKGIELNAILEMNDDSIEKYLKELE